MAEQLAVRVGHLGRAFDRLRELAREAAIGIARAADEGAELAADFEAQASFAAVRARARIGAIALVGKDVRPEQLVQRFEDFADAEILGLGDGAREVLPEVAQDLFPVELVVGDEVELLFEARGEIVFDVALEERFEECRDEAALVVGDEALAVDAHVAAILEHGERRGVGRRPPDAELFHLLDQRRFRIARRRLGEVLLGLDAAIPEVLALAQRRQATALLVLLVAAFLVELEEAIEQDDGAGRAQAVGLAVAALDLDLGGRLLEFGRCHLARDRALPDQLVELRLVLLKMARDVFRAMR